MDDSIEVEVVGWGYDGKIKGGNCAWGLVRKTAKNYLTSFFHGGPLFYSYFFHERTGILLGKTTGWKYGTFYGRKGRYQGGVTLDEFSKFNQKHLPPQELPNGTNSPPTAQAFMGTS